MAGRFKGRQLVGPGGGGVRPTSDRLRETIFNLVDVGETTRVLDGFAGTGALGVEALSRGAAGVTFVERDRVTADVIRENLRRVGCSDTCRIVISDFVGVSRRELSGSRFDLVLLDPPYAWSGLSATLEDAASLVEPGGLVVLEHGKRDEVPTRVAGLESRRMITAGDSRLTIYGAHTRTP